MGEWNDPARMLMREFGAAIRDIRSKLIDEGWFGRAQPEPTRDDAAWFGRDGPTVHDGLLREHFTTQSFEEQWAVREPTADANRPGRDPGFDMDR